ncbi:hypothetical protein B0H16DRAFT_1781979 [Mycena metata]|uniref:Uncharacterized protein n=1 Tax=Mycena metata TaxID=1033252 RepID=A0AAD7MNG8_9AGAR|nr:hypothetical protein B0H16DRAFT_1781979 [Mycena metata]
MRKVLPTAISAITRLRGHISARHCETSSAAAHYFDHTPSFPCRPFALDEPRRRLRLTPAPSDPTAQRKPALSVEINHHLPLRQRPSDDMYALFLPHLLNTYLLNLTQLLLEALMPVLAIRRHGHLTFTLYCCDSSCFSPTGFGLIFGENYRQDREDSLAQRHLVSNLSYELKLRLGLFSTTPLTATSRCPEIIAKLARVSFKFFAFKTISRFNSPRTPCLVRDTLLTTYFHVLPFQENTRPAVDSARDLSRAHHISRFLLSHLDVMVSLYQDLALSIDEVAVAFALQKNVPSPLPREYISLLSSRRFAVPLFFPLLFFCMAPLPGESIGLSLYATIGLARSTLETTRRTVIFENCGIHCQNSPWSLRPAKTANGDLDGLEPNLKSVLINSFCLLGGFAGWSGEFGLVPQLQVDLNRDRESQRV